MLILAVHHPRQGAHAVTGAKSVTQAIAVDGYENINQLGRQLFTTYVFAFEITAGLLTIAVVGAVVCRRRPSDLRADPGARVASSTRATSPSPPMGDEEAALIGQQPRAGLPRACPPSCSCIGGVGLLIRRNPLVMIMCVELMLNAVNLTFVTFGRMLNDIAGQVIVFFVLVVAAAEVVVGLGIIVAISRRRPDATADDIRLLRG